MNEVCSQIHEILNNFRHYQFPYEKSSIPDDGIYILFENGETGHGVHRIVRVGTHSGNGNLKTRLDEHFNKENKDRSIFRKNIGRVYLNKHQDPFLDQWNIDLTTRKAREDNASRQNNEKTKEVERFVTEYIQSHFSFIVLSVPSREKRVSLESKLISTVSLCSQCGPSRDWLGLFSPSEKIRESGLWNEKELYKQPISLYEIEEFRKMYGC